MSNAALTPRVRKIVVCDEASGSDIEDQVFTLEGVRNGFGSDSFPCVRSLGVYLLLSYPRGGRFAGEVRLIPPDVDKVLRITKFTADFDATPYLHALVLELAGCPFPTTGEYSLRVLFVTESGEVLKGEEPFQAWQL
jgi:hypothetical protein